MVPHRILPHIEGFVQMFESCCQHCHRPVRPPFTLCQACETLMFRTLLRLAADLPALYDGLDASLRPGGRQSGRTPAANAPTPIRLDVLDLLDLLDATAYELWRRLIGHDSRRAEGSRHAEDLKATLWKCAGHPRLATLPDAGLYLRTIGDLACRADVLLDPPAPRREIGPCGTCATMLAAGAADQWVRCPACGAEQRVQAVKLRRLERLCFDDSKRGSAAEVARAFTDAGFKVSRKTIGTWRTRGKIAGHPDGYAYCDVYRLLLGPADLT